MRKYKIAPRFAINRSATIHAGCSAVADEAFVRQESTRLEESYGDGQGVDDERQRQQPQVAEGALADLAAALRRRLRGMEP